ncbi:hypothetical protein NECAME_10150 [Necator americanus]|uniref:Uncharacterized protein n=1 Tax=Necator americanus TaxID=51031 RepID=W2TCP7_NECAM|nr:hypothetical protein NECAME_10150 [Necator americanus]ETN78762.1 hypothetical protein NECAME_10150 [Necator americanus]
MEKKDLLDWIREHSMVLKMTHHTLYEIDESISACPGHPKQPERKGFYEGKNMKGRITREQA